MKFRPTTVCAVRSLLATGLTPGAATTDVISATSGGGVIQKSLALHPRASVVRKRRAFADFRIALLLAALTTAIPAFAGDIERISSDGKHKSSIRRGGTVPGGLTLAGNVGGLEALARAGATTVTTVACTNAAPCPYNGNFPQQTLATTTGARWKPFALAKIAIDVESAGAKWKSAGSYVGKNQITSNGAETYNARAIIRDPMFIHGILSGDEVTFELQLGTGMMIFAAPGSGPSVSGSGHISGFDETDLNGIGHLWQWSWSIDSLDLTTTNFSFASNPLLGLDDAVIESLFESNLVFDPVTFIHSLSGPFTVSTTVVAGANQSSYSFGGSEELFLQGASVTEPGTLALLLAALGTCCARRVRIGARQEPVAAA